METSEKPQSKITSWICGPRCFFGWLSGHKALAISLGAALFYVINLATGALDFWSLFVLVTNPQTYVWLASFSDSPFFPWLKVLVLLALIYALISRAVRKDEARDADKRAAEREMISKVDSTLDARLVKYDQKFSALFSHLAGDSRRRDFTDALDVIKTYEKRVQDTVATWDADKAESDSDYGSMTSSGAQFSGLFNELDHILTIFQDNLEFDAYPHLSSVLAVDVKNAATPNLEKITKDGYAKRYQRCMQKTAVVKRILLQKIEKLDERITVDKKILFPKGHQ